MPIDAMHTDDMPSDVNPLSDKELARLNVTSLLLPNTHPLAYYLSGPYGDLAQAIIDGQKRLDVLEAKHAPMRDSLVTSNAGLVGVPVIMDSPEVSVVSVPGL